MSETQFSAADLEPSEEEKQAARRALVDRIAATAAVVASGVWVGGMIALGACAAPFVFRMTPDPFSGDAMSAAFARFDQIALFAAVVVLGAEVTRTWVAGPRGRVLLPRIRRVIGISMAIGAAYTGLSLTPQITNLHRAGVRRGVGPEGHVLERIHKRAEAVGKAEVAFGVALVALHIFTLGVRRPEDDEECSPGPLPPGPRD
jgi:putative copper export protein